MTLPSLLAFLRQHGVQLTVQGDRLLVDAPAGVMTVDLRAALAEQKPALLRRLVECERLAAWCLGLIDKGTPVLTPSSLAVLALMRECVVGYREAADAE